jgi:predicted glycosyltransferase
MVFTGYIPRKVLSANVILKSRKEMGLGEKDQLVVVTTGGGGDGYRVMDTYLSMLESEFQSLPPFKSVLITGPFMPKKLRKKVFKRSKALGIKTFHFYRNMEKLLAAADLVVSMGGYNTMCELLSLGTTALIIPRDTPRKEQLIRADIFKRQNLIDYLPWSKCQASLMAQKMRSLLSSPEPYRSAISRFQMTGIEVMRSRLHSLKYSEMEACSHLTLIKQTG